MKRIVETKTLAPDRTKGQSAILYSNADGRISIYPRTVDDNDAFIEYLRLAIESYNSKD